MPFDFSRLRSMFNPQEMYERFKGMGSPPEQPPQQSSGVGSIFNGGMPGGGMLGNDLPQQGGITGNMPFPQPGPQPTGLGEMGQVFGVPNVNMPNTQQTPIGMSEQDEINQIMAGYTPQHEMSNRLKDLVTNMPQREKPSKLRRLGAILAGVTVDDPTIGDRVMNAPYYEKLADWQRQINPTVQAAQIERYGNANDRQAAYQNAQSEVSRRRASVAEEAEKRRQAKSEADIERDKKKNDIARYKAENPDTDLVDDATTGNVFIVKRDGTKIDTGLKHGDFSDLEKAQWRRGDVQARIDARQKEDDDRNAAKNWTTIYDYKPDGTATAISYNRVTRERVPITRPTTPPSREPGTSDVTAKPALLPTQQAQDIENRINEIVNRNPNWKQWIRIVNGQPKITPPSKTLGYSFGPDEATFKAMNDAVFGGNTNNPQTPPVGGRPGGTYRQLPSGARIYVEP